MKIGVVQPFLQVFQRVKERPRTSAAAALLVLALAWFFLIRSGNGETETLVMEPTDFVGQVTVAGAVVSAHAVDLGFTQSGRIAGVYVKPGDTAAAGKTLANIENGDLRALVLQRQAAYEVQLAKLASLEQGTRPEQLAVTESSVASARTALEQAHQAVTDEVRDSYIAAEDAVRNKMDQFFSNVNTPAPELTITVTDGQQEIDLESGRANLERMLTVWRASLSVAPADIAAVDAQSKLSAVASFLANATSALATALPNAAVSKATLAEYVADIATARGSISAALSALTTAETSRKSAAAALVTAEKNLALARAGTSRADLDAQRAQVKAAEADVAAAQAQLAQTLIRAPFSGMVTRTDIEPGEIVSPNTPVISMIGTGTFQIESYVPEVNIAELEVGDTAAVTLDAYGPARSFEAVVITIDPAETVRDGVSTYKTTLQFTDADPRIRSGMTANIVIETVRKSGAIVIPKGAIVERDGKRFAAVLVGGEREEREIRTGSESLGQVEVTLGLAPQDVLVLNP